MCVCVLVPAVEFVCACVYVCMCLCVCVCLLHSLFLIYFLAVDKKILALSTLTRNDLLNFCHSLILADAPARRKLSTQVQGSVNEGRDLSSSYTSSSSSARAERAVTAITTPSSFKHTLPLYPSLFDSAHSDTLSSFFSLLSHDSDTALPCEADTTHENNVESTTCIVCVCVLLLADPVLVRFASPVCS